MTEEQRESLRAEVARRVMNWHANEVSWAYSGSTECWHTSDEVAVVTRYAWRPDEDDQQNMNVLDRMTALGFDCSVELTPEEAVVAFSRESAEGQPVSHGCRRIAVLLAAVAAIKS